jgi:hypothetical protein
MVTGALPVDIRTSCCVAVEFKFTVPKAIVVAFVLSVGVAVPSCIVKVVATLLALAVNVTV